MNATQGLAAHAGSRDDGTRFQFQPASRSLLWCLVVMLGLGCGGEQEPIARSVADASGPSTPTEDVAPTRNVSDAARPTEMDDTTPGPIDDGGTTWDDTGLQGFAAAVGVTGGAGGASLVVTNIDASGPGSLPEAIRAEGPRLITFVPGLRGTITFSNVVYVDHPDMTIDGRGADITISGYSLSVFTGSGAPAHNIVIRNLTFADTEPGRNAVNIEYASTGVWVDHCTFRNNTLGNVGQGVAVWDRGRGLGGLTGITISWNKFEAPNRKSLLIGSESQEGRKTIRVSVHHNWFEGVVARNPRVHGGALVHMWNNYVSGWSEYGAGVSGPTDLLAENNIFSHDGGLAIDADYGDSPAHSVNATGNLLLGSPLPNIETRGTFPREELVYSAHLAPADSVLMERITEWAGAQ